MSLPKGQQIKELIQSTTQWGSVPGGLIEIIKTFSDCHHLQQVDFPTNLMSIEEKAFANCYRLQTVNFPASLNIIGSEAFRSCPLLEDLHFNSRSPENISIDKNAFDKHVFKTAIVFVPEGCEDAYRNSKAFAKFQHICSID